MFFLFGNTFLHKTHRCLIGFSLFLSPLAFSAEKTVENSGWHTIFSPYFYEVERFFLQSRCKPYLSGGYLYDLSRQHWLSGKEANQLAPKFSLLFFQQKKPCNIQVGVKELEKLLRVSFQSKKGVVYLFINRVDSEKIPKNITEFLPMSQRAKDLYKKRLELAKKLPYEKYMINLVVSGQVPYDEFIKTHGKFIPPT